MTTVAYQGEPGAFSEDAARRLVADAEPRGYTTFDDVIDAVESGANDLALLPVENSIYGPIARAYDLLWEHPALHVVDEIVYHVIQSLIGTIDTTIETIVEVRSHPVALEQCRLLFDAHPSWRRAIVDDTAGAVRDVVARGDRTIAAIAHASAAARYGARVLREGVQDDPDNATRFFLVSRERPQTTQGKRACIIVELHDRPGSLRDALSAFADRDMNLRSLVARPSHRGAFRYRFTCELENVANDRLAAAITAIGGEARVVGIY